MGKYLTFLSSIFLSACANEAVQNQIATMGPDIGSLEERMVLVNLGRFIEKPWGVPGHVEINSGSVQNQDQAGINLSLPLHGTGQSISPSVTLLQETDILSTLPVTDADDLRRLRALYHSAVCPDDSLLIQEWAAASEIDVHPVVPARESFPAQARSKQASNAVPTSTAPKTPKASQTPTFQTPKELSPLLKQFQKKPDITMPGETGINETEKWRTTAQVQGGTAPPLDRKVKSTLAPPGGNDKSSTASHIARILDYRLRAALQIGRGDRWLFWTGGSPEAPCYPNKRPNHEPPSGTVPLGTFNGYTLYIDPRSPSFGNFTLAVLSAVPDTVGYPSLPELGSKARNNSVNASITNAIANSPR